VRSYVPTGEAAEASLIEGLNAYSFLSLLALVDHLTSYARWCLSNATYCWATPTPYLPTPPALLKSKAKYQHKELTITEDRTRFNLAEYF
jgi:hypothetical protein